MPSKIVRQVQHAIKSKSLDNLFLINSENGKLSVKALTALCGLSPSALIKNLESVNTHLSQRLARKDYSSSALLKEGFCPEAIWEVLLYYANESKANAYSAHKIVEAFSLKDIQNAMAIVNSGVGSQKSAPAINKSTIPEALASYENAAPKPTYLTIKTGPTVAEQVKMLHEAFDAFDLLGNAKLKRLAASYIESLLD